MLTPFLNLFDAILALVILVLVANVVLSWLFAFDIISRRNAFLDTLYTFTSRLTDPLLRPIRRFIPPISGIDLSPLVLLLGIQFIRELLPRIAYAVFS
ncbi:MAG: YggT family protein [Alphaproteobacteria bacterium]|nr:YggT family protein [Alphaproteobacteria bacterium]